MKLYPVTDQYSIQGAVGQLSKVRYQFGSDEPLTGKLIRLYPALFLGRKDIPQGSTYFQVNYPAATTGEGNEMTYLGDDVNSNYRAYIKVIDAQNFVITYYFFFLSDLRDYLGDNSYSNSNMFFSRRGVYSNESKISLYVDIPQEGVAADGVVAAYGTHFCTDEITWQIGELGGFKPSENLEVEISLDEDGVSNIYQVGFIDLNNINDTQFFADAYALNYAEITGGVDQVDDQIPITAFSSATGFQYENNTSKATVTIAGSALKAGGRYALYVVYMIDGRWRSCKSPNIIQLESERDQILTTVDFTIKDGFGTSHPEQCVKNMAPHGVVEVCATFKRSTWEANLAAEGYTGTMEDFFIKADARMSNGNPSTTGDLGGGSSLTPTIQFTAGGLKMCVNYNAQDVQGEKFFTFGMHMNVDGVTDILYAVSSIKFSNIEPAGYTIDGETAQSQLCFENGNFTVDVDDCSGTIKNYLKFSGSYTALADGASLDLDPADLGIGLAPCLRTICIGTPSGGGGGGGSTCDCAKLCGRAVPFEINQLWHCFGSAENFQTGDCTATITFDFPQGYTSISVYDYYTGTTQTGSDITFNINLPMFYLNKNSFTNRYLVIAERDDGCVYRKDFEFTTAGGSTTPTTIFAILDDCSCIEVDPVEPTPPVNLIWFNYTKNEETGAITIIPEEYFESPIESDDISGSLSGNKRVEVTRKVKFSDGTLPLEANQMVYARVLEVCQNDLDVEVDVEDNILTITQTEDFNSTIENDTGMLYSLNGGRSFQEYTSPVTLQGGEIIVWQRKVFFDDTCPDIEVEGSSVNNKRSNPTFCDYSAYTLQCTYNTDTLMFSLTTTGNRENLDIDELLWTLNGYNPFDENNSGVEYTVPVMGDGLFIARWKIKLPDCPEMMVDAFCFGERKIAPLEFDPNSSPISIEISPTSLPIEICTVPCSACDFIATITCDTDILSVTNTPAQTGESYTWFDNSNNILGQNPTITIDGMVAASYRVEVTVNDNGNICTASAIYNHFPPEVGEGQGGPIIVT